MAKPDPESNARAWKAIGLAVLAPAAVYYLIFQHFRCVTTAEQLAAVILAIAGIGAAMAWA